MFVLQGYHNGAAKGSAAAPGGGQAPPGKEKARGPEGPRACRRKISEEFVQLSLDLGHLFDVRVAVELAARDDHLDLAQRLEAVQRVVGGDDQVSRDDPGRRHEEHQPGGGPEQVEDDRQREDRDVGDAMEMSAAAVKSLLSRARETLRVQLEAYVK